MSRLILNEISLRRSPSTRCCSSMTFRILLISSSFSSRTFVSGFDFGAQPEFCWLANVRFRKCTSVRFRFFCLAEDPRRQYAPSIPLPLSLFVFRVHANDAHDALAMHDLALVTNFLNRCSDFHKTSICICTRSGLASDRMAKARRRPCLPGRMRMKFFLIFPEM